MSLLQLTSLLSKWPTAPQKKEPILREHYDSRSNNFEDSLAAYGATKKDTSLPKLNFASTVTKFKAIFQQLAQKAKRQWQRVSKSSTAIWYKLRHAFTKVAHYSRELADAYQANDKGKDTLKERYHQKQPTEKHTPPHAGLWHG